MASEPPSNANITSTHTLSNIPDEEVKVMVPPLNFAMVAPDEFNKELRQFVNEQEIKVFHYKIDGNKEPFIEIEQKEINIRNHPVLIHCNKGKHRIGCLVGCLRKLQKWSLTSIFHEYRRFAVTKVLADQEFIEIFSEHVPYNPDFKPDWL
ncbi:9483_t:CDS:2 [Dentiscutata heterogama]|uniref:9483_t:CDS:1 n=1 Tax=Dentiscutata heterogama TaxID=1316150 RepID=A0ACA9KN05_9GLOM|nr:9483_t:CDS:2 [Dentiscutata heterogama]